MLQKTRRDIKIHKMRKHANPGETIYEELKGKEEKEMSKNLLSGSVEKPSKMRQSLKHTGEQFIKHLISK